jgi:uncharacterized protein (TIGR00369 family)
VGPGGCAILIKQVSFPPKDPNFEARVRASFAQQSAMRTLGVEIVKIEPGEVEFSMLYSANFTQQNGYIHAGIITTALDSACGYAAFSLMPADAAVLTVEFKTTLTAPAKGDRFIFRANVIKPGRALTFCEARAFGVTNGEERLIATMSGTLFALFEKQG